MSAGVTGLPDLVRDPLLAMPPIMTTGGGTSADAAPSTCADAIDMSAQLTLTDAIDAALCTNSQTQAAWATIKVQAAQVGQARAAYLPTLNGSITGQRNATRYPDFPSSGNSVNGYSTYLSLNWRLFDFGEREAHRHATNDLLSAALASYDAAIQKTMAQTIHAYFDALTAQGALDAREQATDVAERTLAAARRRESRGVASRSDTLQAQTALARTRLAQQRAKADADKAIASLIYVIGAPADTGITLPPAVPLFAKRPLPELSELMATAKANHPAIVAARAHQTASEDNIEVERAEGLPTIDLGVTTYQNGYPNQSVQSTRSNTIVAGITLTIPLFDGFSRTYKVRQAQAEAEQSAVQALDTEHQVLSDLIKSYADARSAQENLDASAQLLNAAKASLASASNRYEHGVADILELLSAQGALDDAQQSRVQCESEWNSAYLKLIADAGQLGMGQIRNTDTHADVLH
ncbi:TolC family protein [Paraburkholderia mimosarum]|uniref:TolC family protein n=1 Tax=Paraburkholderia mimosarum TaxID=312026 RepID=UPI00041BF078|nr:TolC family protein [Paraburkholderia mimosarum]